MKMKCTLAAAVLVACGIACGARAAVLKYQQDFSGPAPPQNGAILPWSVNMIGGFSGTYSGSFDPMGLRDAATNLPIPGNTGVFTGIGGPVTGDLRMFYTVDGQAGFSSFNPATCPGCTFNVYANLQGGGVDDFGRFAILAGGPGARDPVAWYISTTPTAAPTSSGALFDLRSLPYNPAAGNWNNLTVDQTNTVAPVVGGPAGSLAGLFIKGVGVVHSVTNPASDFSSWNYAYYTITCVPEPAALMLVVIGATARLSFDGGKSKRFSHTQSGLEVAVGCCRQPLSDLERLPILHRQVSGVVLKSGHGTRLGGRLARTDSTEHSLTISFGVRRGRVLELVATSLIVFACAPSQLFAGEYMVGADLSFLANAEQNGVVFKDNGQAKPGLQIFRDHGYNWIRLRLFHSPDRLPNDLSYTIAQAKAAKQLGYKFLLNYHYSDTWADPQKQFIPKAWEGLSHEALVDAVYGYTRDTIAAFREAGVMPDMVQIGNEVIGGMLWPDGRLPKQWDNFADLLKAGIRGVDAGRGDATRSEIMIHIDRGGDMRSTKSFFDKCREHGVEYDVIGQSYYPWWHGSLDDLRKNMAFMAGEYGKDIVLVEVAYNWRPAEYRDKAAPFPETPEGQRDFLTHVNQIVLETPQHRGRGIFWWEPAVRPGPIASRGIFDRDGNALPAISVFDKSVAQKTSEAVGN